jgi:hypothetical protein
MVLIPLLRLFFDLQLDATDFRLGAKYLPHCSVPAWAAKILAETKMPRSFVVLADPDIVSTELSITHWDEFVFAIRFSLGCVSTFSSSDSVGSHNHPTFRYIFRTFPLPRNPQNLCRLHSILRHGKQWASIRPFPIISWAPFVCHLFKTLGGGKVIQFHEFPLSFEIRFVFKSFLFGSLLIIFAISCHYFGIPAMD